MLACTLPDCHALLPCRGDGENEGERQGNGDAQQQPLRVVVDGWLAINVPARALGPLFLLRQRISACFASKARLLSRVFASSDKPRRACHLHEVFNIALLHDSAVPLHDSVSPLWAESRLVACRVHALPAECAPALTQS